MLPWQHFNSFVSELGSSTFLFLHIEHKTGCGLAGTVAAFNSDQAKYTKTWENEKLWSGGHDLAEPLRPPPRLLQCRLRPLLFVSVEKPSMNVNWTEPCRGSLNRSGPFTFPLNVHQFLSCSFLWSLTTMSVWTHPRSRPLRSSSSCEDAWSHRVSLMKHTKYFLTQWKVVGDTKRAIMSEWDFLNLTLLIFIFFCLCQFVVVSSFMF